jgi:hypothetical protein
MLKVNDSPELQAALLSVRQAGSDIRSDINKDARSQLKPEWNAQLVQKADTLLERRALIPGARVTFGRNNVTVVGAASRRPLSGGLIPDLNFAGIEWGSDRLRQFRRRSRKGYVVGPAAGEFGARAVAVWVHTIVAHFDRNWEVTP